MLSESEASLAYPHVASCPRCFALAQHDRGLSVSVVNVHFQGSNIAYQAKGRPVIGVRIAGICTLDEGALGSSQRLHLAFSIQQMLIEALHQFAGGVIFN